MSDCITALIAALLIAYFLGDNGANSRCGRNRGCNDRCDSSCG